MFREMRRENKAMSREAAEQVLKAGSHGVMACLGDGGYPYAVPLSYVYDQGCIYFHCAAGVGHKLEAIAKEPKVSFCVVGRDQVVPEEVTTKFTSVIAFGRARVLTEAAEIRAAALKLLEKYCGQAEANETYLQEAWGKFAMAAIEIDHLSGKATPESV